MAETISRKSIVYDITFESGNAQKGARDIGGAMGKAEKEIDKAGKAVDNFAKKTMSAVTELRAIKAQLNSFSGSQKDFERLSLRAAQLTDQIENTNRRIAVLASSTRNIQALSSAFAGLTGVFTAVQGAQAVFGRESENVQRALVKLQGSLALLQGVQAAVATVTEQSAAKTVILLNAQKLYTFIVGTSTGALKAFRLALAGTGIGLFVIAVTLLINKFSQLTKSTKEQTDALREHLKVVDNTTKGINELAASNRQAADGGIEDYRRLIKVAEETGASEERIFQLKSQLLEKELFELREQQREIEQLRGISFGQQVLQLNKISNAIKDKEAEIFVLRKKQLQDLGKVEQQEAPILFDAEERLSDVRDFTVKQKAILDEAFEEINNIQNENIPIAPLIDTDALEAGTQKLRESTQAAATFGEVIKDNATEISQSFQTIFGNLAGLAKQGSDAQIALSIANILIANAEAMAKAISSAASIPFPGNIPAILTSVATITSLFAQVNALVGQAKAAQSQSTSATAFAEGEIDIHRSGETRGKDSIPAVIMPGESVITTAATSQYKPFLEAIQHGSLEDMIRVNYVEPALAVAALDSAAGGSHAPDYSERFYRQLLATGEGNINGKRAVRFLASIDKKLTPKDKRYSR